MPYVDISKKFYTAALANNWKKAEYHLKNYDATGKRYIDRVKREANLLKQERLLK